MSEENKKLALENIKFPLRYEESKAIVVECDGTMVFYVCALGKIDLSPEELKIHTTIGHFVAETLNKEAEKKWIPVSERLPDTDRDVWLTVTNKSETKTVTANYYPHFGSSWGVGDEFLKGFAYEPIAWQEIEIPAPYEGEI